MRASLLFDLCAFRNTTSAWTCVALLMFLHGGLLSGARADDMSTEVSSTPRRSRAAVELRWDVPAGQRCPTPEALSSEVEARLGRPVFSADESRPRFVLIGAMRQVGGQWNVELTLLDPEGRGLGQRALMGSSSACDSLFRSIAIVVSLLVDQQSERIVLYEPAPPTTSMTPSGEGEALLPDAVESPASRPSWRSSLALGGSVSGFGLPGPAWGVHQIVSLGLPEIPLSIAIEGLIAPTFLVQGPEAAAEVWFWAAGLTLCPEFLEEPELRIISCAGVMTGQLYAQGIDFDITRNGGGAHVELALRGGVEVRVIGPLSVRLLGLVDVPLLKRDLSFGDPRGERLLHETGPVSLCIALFLGISLPPP